MSAKVEIIAPPDALARKVGVRKPGEPAVDMEAVARMEQALADQSAAFAPVLDAWVVQAATIASSAPTAAQTALLSDMAHEIRGLAGSVGHDLAGAVAGSLWTYLDGCQGAPDAEVLATFGDALRLGRVLKGPVTDDGRRVLDGLGAAARARVHRP